MKLIKSFIKALVNEDYKQCDQIINQIESLKNRNPFIGFSIPNVPYMPYLKAEQTEKLLQLIALVGFDSRFLNLLQVADFSILGQNKYRDLIAKIVHETVKSGSVPAWISHMIKWLSVDELLPIVTSLDRITSRRLIKIKPELIPTLIQTDNDDMLLSVLILYISREVELRQQDLIALLKKVKLLHDNIFRYISRQDVSFLWTAKLPCSVIEALTDEELASLIDKLVSETQGPLFSIEETCYKRVLLLPVSYPDLTGKIKVLVSSTPWSEIIYCIKASLNCPERIEAFVKKFPADQVGQIMYVILNEDRYRNSEIEKMLSRIDKTDYIEFLSNLRTQSNIS
ncbi:MAG: hypothetical protein ACPLSN_06645 [Dictyoglomus turgidum]